MKEVTACKRLTLLYFTHVIGRFIIEALVQCVAVHYGISTEVPKSYPDILLPAYVAGS